MRRREFIGLIAGAGAWPLATRAQQKLPVIGYLHFDKSGSPLQQAFLEGLKDTGFVAGQNVAIEYRWAEGRYDRSQAMAADLVGRKVDVIAAFGPPLARAAKDATATIPVVFEVGNDAVEAGLVESISRPGGNVTGVNVLFTELTPKLLELICEIVPGMRIVGLLVNPNSPTAKPTIVKAEEAARAKGIRLVIVRASTESEIDAAFATLIASQAQAFIVGADPFLGTQDQQIVAQAARRRLPAIYFSGRYTQAGGLASYGANLAAVYRRTGEYVGKILKGEKPANLPVEQPTRFDLSINLKTARTLGLNIPPSLLGRAEEVIE